MTKCIQKMGQKYLDTNHVRNSWKALRLLHLEKKVLVEYDGQNQTSEGQHAEKEFDLLLSF